MAANTGTGSSDSELIQFRPALTYAPTSVSGILTLSFKSAPLMRESVERERKERKVEVTDLILLY